MLFHTKIRIKVGIEKSSYKHRLWLDLINLSFLCRLQFKFFCHRVNIYMFILVDCETSISCLFKTFLTLLDLSRILCKLSSMNIYFLVFLLEAIFIESRWKTDKTSALKCRKLIRSFKEVILNYFLLGEAMHSNVKLTWLA